MSEKKYELTDEVKKFSTGKVLHRIRAVKQFTICEGVVVKKGEYGGWVESEDNLSQDGSAWVYDNAMVYGTSRVYGSAVILGSARVFGSACVFGEAMVFESAHVCGEALVHGNASVHGTARVFDHACVCGNAQIFGKARVKGRAMVRCCANVCNEAVIGGEAVVGGEAHIVGDASVNDTNDYAVFKNVWSSGRWFTYTRSNKKWTVGCFRGTGEELIAKAYKDGELSGQCYEAIVRVQEAIDKAIENTKRAK